MFPAKLHKDKLINAAITGTYRYTEKLDFSMGVAFDTRDTSRDQAPGEEPVSLDYDELSFNVLAIYRIK